ncbi:MAG: prolyl oligopeptidase family serine peptidase [Clostridiaceae bacterium]|nr:prolyl oligopeptidase family serine peptidase [Clostridiaceae bacterium]
MKKIVAEAFVGYFGRMVRAFRIACGETAPQLTPENFQVTGNYRMTRGKGCSRGVTAVTAEQETLYLEVDPFLLDGEFTVSCSEEQFSFTRADVSEVQTYIADEFTREEESGVHYRLYTPQGSGPRPLLLFLHGGGEGGDDNDRHLSQLYGAPVWAERFPEMYVMAPQAPRNENTLRSILIEPHETVEGDPFQALVNGNFRVFKRPACRDRGDWTRQLLYQVCQIIRGMIAEGKVDPRRVYVTGLSMGGAGSIRAMSVDRDLFAAALPVCPMTSDDTFHELNALGNSKICIATSYLDNLFERNKYLLDGIMKLQDEGNRHADMVIFSRQEIQAYGIGMEPGTTLAEQLMMNHAAAWILAYNNEHGLMNWLTSQVKDN